MMKRARVRVILAPLADEALQLYWLLGDLITRDYVISPNDFSSRLQLIVTPRCHETKFSPFSRLLIDEGVKISLSAFLIESGAVWRAQGTRNNCRSLFAMCARIQMCCFHRQRHG